MQMMKECKANAEIAGCNKMMCTMQLSRKLVRRIELDV